MIKIVKGILFVTVFGVSMLSAEIIATPTSYDFGDVRINTTQQYDITLTNTGGSGEIIWGIDIIESDGIADEFWQENNCDILSAGNSCVITVYFRPTLGAYQTAIMSVVGTFGGSVDVQLAGTGTIDVSPTSLNFGEVYIGESKEYYVMVENTTDDVVLTINGITILGENSDDFHQTNNCGQLLPSGTCTVTVSFTPTSAGSKTAALSVSTNVPDLVATANVPLVGSGLTKSPEVQVNDIIEFIESGVLVGTGRGNSADKRINALKNMIEAAKDLIEIEATVEACEQLLSAYQLTDGDSTPPDFVSGDTADDLANMIQEVMESLVCT